MDPDFLVGWEVQLASLGYLLERAPYLHLNDMHRRLSRLRVLGPGEGRGEGGREGQEWVEQVGEGRADEWGEEHQSGIWVLGKREGGREVGWEVGRGEHDW